MKKTYVFCPLFLALFALTLLAAAAPAGAAIVTAPSEMRAGYTATFVSDPASIYIWEFPIGEPRTAFTREVVWKAPNAKGSAPLTVTAKLTADGVVYTSGMTIYSLLEIRRKASIPEVVLYGETTLNPDGDPYLVVAGGNSSNYTWTVTGPLDNDPFHDYSYGGFTRNGNTFVFVSPSEGQFSGQYTVTIADGLQETDYVNFYVPPYIDAFGYVFTEAGPPFPVILKGAPDTATYTPVLFDGKGQDAEILTDAAQYGTFTVAGASSGGYLTATYTPPADIETPQPFWFGMQPQNVELLWDELYNIYEPLPRGAMHIRDMRNFTGTIVRPDGVTPIVGAKVDLVAPKQFIQTLVTDFQGEFSFRLPASGKYYFTVSEPSYLEKSFTSVLLPRPPEDDNPVALESAAANSYIEGTVSAEGLPLTNGTEVKVALIYHDAADIPVFVRDTQILGNQFRLSFGENLPARDYSIIAYNPGYYARHDLPTASSVPPPYTGVNLDMARFHDLPPNILPPLTAGYTMNINDEDGILGAILELPAGCFKVGTLIQPPTPPEVGVQGEIRHGQRDDPFVAASETLLNIKVVDNAPLAYTEHNFEVINERGMYLTLPFDLTYVNEGDIEVNNIKVRHSAVNLTDLKGCSAIVVPQDDILAIDYLGDGNIGWVTFWVVDGDFFGIGNPCNPADDGARVFAFPGFDRYEFYGCFLQSIE
ncbi:MAG: carboxypeptidase-like regulatory domain-containing protein [Proteobacteria bacterium]|nr:carboxypeptidase-like regulatory domain-containing protein [Pseudomonadota bacterium]